MTITVFLSQQTDDARAVLVENKHRHGEAEVHEILTDAEEVCGEVVVKEKVIESRLDRCGGFGGAVLQPRTVAALGIGNSILKHWQVAYVSSFSTSASKSNGI